MPSFRKFLRGKLRSARHIFADRSYLSQTFPDDADNPRKAPGIRFVDEAVLFRLRAIFCFLQL